MTDAIRVNFKDFFETYELLRGTQGWEFLKFSGVHTKCKQASGAGVDFLRSSDTIYCFAHFPATIEGNSLLLMASTIDLRSVSLDFNEIYISKDENGNLPTILTDENTQISANVIYLQNDFDAEEFLDSIPNITIQSMYKFATNRDLGIYAPLTSEIKQTYGLHYPYDDEMMEEGLPILDFTPIPSNITEVDLYKENSINPDDESLSDTNLCGLHLNLISY